MIGIAINILWFLIGLAVLVGIIWLAFYVIEMLGLAIPERIKQVVWVIVLLLALIALLTILAGGSVGNFSFHHAALHFPSRILAALSISTA